MKALWNHPPGAAWEAAARLHDSPYLSLKAVSCEFRDGVLTLRGCLPTYYFKQMAQTAVAGLEGVVSVDNQIEVAVADADVRGDGPP